MEVSFLGMDMFIPGQYRSVPAYAALWTWNDTE
jgi:hypothetical protein